MTVAVNLAIAVALACLRVSGEKGELFQAVAHLYVGLLIGLAWANYQFLHTPWRFYAWVALALSVIELACFLLGVGH